MRFLSLLLLLCLCFTFAVGTGVAPVAAEVKAFDAQDFTLTHLTATDAVGRTLPAISGYENDKYVGVFYFLWHGQHTSANYDGGTVRNVTQLLKTNYNDLFSTDKANKVVPESSWLHVNEPLYGYYSSTDEWVMRKHIELFIAADVDFVMFDFTNGYYYKDPLNLFMQLLREYKDAGWDVPQVSFYLWIDGNRLATRLMKNIYNKEEYKDLVFYGNSEKPIIVASLEYDSQELGSLVDDSVKEYFDVRQSAVMYSKDHSLLWPYWQFKRDWKVYKDMVNVSGAQAQSAFSFAYESAPGYEKSSEVHGRGWSSSNPKNGDVQAILRGDNIQEGWDNAISKDPDIVFVCGWNEWVVQKAFLPNGFPHYTDNFSVEFSRDIEMMKSATYVSDGKGGYTEEGFGDNYYLQLAYNIRRFKGIAAEASDFEAPGKVSIDINGSLDQWNAVKETYLALSTNKEARDAKGFYLGKTYKQAAPANIIENMQVTYDDNNVYFKITAKENISKYKSGTTNWMNLYVGIEGSDKATWSTFNYVINRTPGSDGKTSVEYFTKDGAYTLAKSGDASYKVSGNVLQIAVPRSVLGLSGNEINLTFKVADGVKETDNILDYYVTGDVFPVGRYAYTYQTAYSESAPMPTNDPVNSATNHPEATPGEDGNKVQNGKDSGNGLIIGVAIGVAALAVAAVVIVAICVKKKGTKAQ